jgi:uncharacterized protein (TIGR02001 family)
MKTVALFPAAFAAALVATAPATAQDDILPGDGPAFDLSSTVSIVSDYRFRGISLSNRKPPVQASFDVAHQSGIYSGVWASTIAKTGGSRVEVDLYLGYKAPVGPVELDAGILGYVYPGGKGVSYMETYAYLGRTIGPAELKVGAVYAPAQKNIGGSDNLYLTGEARVGIPGTPFTALTSVGRERGSLAGVTGRKWDWSLGAEYTRAPFTVGLSYTDTDVKRINDLSKNARPGVVAAASVEF